MCDEVSIKGRKFNQQASTYVLPKSVPRAERCYAVMFTNVGDVIAWVEGMIIYPATTQPGIGDSRSFSGFQNDEYAGNIVLSFDPATAGTNPAVEVVQFFYLK